ncbi:hypothetical protein CKO09_10655 [Chromatium weissei]|nr:hypothetical protein [Chromatium weissei]
MDIKKVWNELRDTLQSGQSSELTNQQRASEGEELARFFSTDETISKPAPAKPAAPIQKDELVRFLELSIAAPTDDFLRQLAARETNANNTIKDLRERVDKLEKSERTLKQNLRQQTLPATNQGLNVNDITQHLTTRVEQLEKSGQQLVEKIKKQITPQPTPQQNQQVIRGRYQILSDGMILDTKTNLHWMRCVLGQSWNGSSCVGAGVKFNWIEAQNAAIMSHYAGYSDWRLPTIDELKSLVIVGQNPTIDQAAFPNTPPNWFWSSSLVESGSESAWHLNFSTGRASYDYRYEQNYVRLVRNRK